MPEMAKTVGFWFGRLHVSPITEDDLGWSHGITEWFMKRTAKRPHFIEVHRVDILL
jgi:hypothetical protein